MVSGDSSPTQSDTATVGPDASGTDTVAGRDAVDRAHVEFAPGGKVGRFHIIERVGVGSMGAVYAAYDPELDRRVAIKVLATQHLEAERARGRLLREAQAMARLSHPNVVSVHDVGTVEQHVYLAMEFVDGVTLGEWIEAGPRTWREVLAVFLPAAEGLAAAHDKEIVHGDFKPANVLVADEGSRVLVTDFGLARADHSTDSQEGWRSSDSSGSGVSALLREEFTGTTTLLGTPAYMAPEQFRGDPSDARTDQFNFCVALWEALYSERPFDGQGPGLMVAVLEGSRRPVPAAPVPAWLRRAVERGLSLAPQDRWPTLRDLLDALDRDPGRGRRWVLGAGLFVAGAVAAAGAWNWSRDRADAICSDAGAEIAGVWSENRRSQLEDRIEQSGGVDAEITADVVARRVDEWSAGWSDARTDACLRDRSGKTTAAVSTASELCFAQRAEILDVTLETLEGMQGNEINAAIPSVSQLPAVHTCVDSKALRHGGEFEAHHDIPRERMIAWERSLQRARTLRTAGRLDDALALAQEVVDDTEAPTSLRARAKLENGTTQMWLEDYAASRAELENAYFLALDADAKATAFEAALVLARLVQTELFGVDTAQLWLRLAEASLEDWDTIGKAKLHRARVVVHKTDGDALAALAAARESLELFEKELGPTAVEVAETKRTVGIILNELQRFDEARPYNRHVVDAFSEVFGPSHMRLARARNTYGQSLEGSGRYARAQQQYELALEAFAAINTNKGLAEAMVESNLAGLLLRRKEYDSSARWARASYEKRRDGLGRFHAFTLKTLAVLVDALAESGRADSAQDLLTGELAACGSSSCAAKLHRNLGLLHRREGKPNLAEPHLREALRMSSNQPRSNRAQALINLASLRAEIGDTEEAEHLALEAAETLRSAKGETPRALLIEHESLARLLVDLGLPQRARSQLELAMAVGRAAGHGQGGRLEHVEQMLRELPVPPKPRTP